MVESLPEVVASWSRFYGEHTSVSSAIRFLHLASVIVGGGTALTIDRMVLGGDGDAERRSRVLLALAEAHRVVVPCLALAAVTGVLMAGADAETFLASRAFGAKVLTLVALGVNGEALRRAEAALRRTGADRAWRTLRWAAGLSTALWLLVVLIAVRLAYS